MGHPSFVIEKNLWIFIQSDKWDFREKQIDVSRFHERVPATEDIWARRHMRQNLNVNINGNVI